MANYYYNGQESRLERISWRMWIVEIACYIALVLLTSVSAFSGLSAGTGFPCFFGTVGESNFGEDLIGNSVQPHHQNGVKIFFMSSIATQFVVFSALFVWLAIAVYLLVGCIRVKMCNYDPSYGASELSSAVATMTALVALTISVWAWQVFVLLLSYRQLTLAAGTFAGIYVAGLAFLGAFASSGMTPEEYSVFNFQLKTVCKKVHTVITSFKAVTLNLFAAMIGLWNLVLVLLGAVIMVLNFGVPIPNATIGALTIFIVLGLAYLVVIEVLVARYVHVLLGPHIGMIVALGIAGTSALSYSETLDAIMYPSWKPVTAGILGAFAVVVVALAILRVVRAYRYHKARQSKFIQKIAAVTESMKPSRGSGGGNRRKRTNNGTAHPKAYYDSVPMEPFRDDPHHPAPYRPPPEPPQPQDFEEVIYENVPY
nr:MAG: envelope glycoprotein M [Turdid alphaherpesvirus 1]